MKVTYTTPFTMVANKIIQSFELTIYQKMVYIILCSHANQRKGCFPSYTTIANECGCSRRKVIDTIGELEKTGYIIINHRKDKSGKHKSNDYEIVVDNSADGAYSASHSESYALPNSESPASNSECGAPELYKDNNIKSFNNIHLSISEQDELDGIINNAQLDVLDNQTDRDLFEEVIRRMYRAETITVHGYEQPQIAVRMRLKNLNADIICSAFDKFKGEFPRRPINYLTALLYNEMCEYDSFNLQCDRALEAM